MTKLDLESKMDFDRSVGTEDRFALRRWFGRFVELLNQTNPDFWLDIFSSDLAVAGFTDAPLDCTGFMNYLKAENEIGEYAARFPELKVGFQDGTFKLKGTFESFSDKVLLADGSIALEIVKDEAGQFRVTSIELEPRFIVKRAVVT